MAPKPKFLVTNMSRQTSAANLASARAFRRSPIGDGILDCDIKGVVVVVRSRGM